MGRVITDAGGTQGSGGAGCCWLLVQDSSALGWWSLLLLGTHGGILPFAAPPSPPQPLLYVLAILNVFALFSVENKTFPSKVVSGAVLSLSTSLSVQPGFGVPQGYILSVSHMSRGRRVCPSAY